MTVLTEVIQFKNVPTSFKHSTWTTQELIFKYAPFTFKQFLVFSFWLYSRALRCYCLPEQNVRRTMIYERSDKYYIKSPELSSAVCILVRLLTILGLIFAVRLYLQLKIGKKTNEKPCNKFLIKPVCSVCAEKALSTLRFFALT